MSHTLPNYLRTHRRRSGFSQDEIAFLLGGHAGTTVSRHERLGRVPSLRRVFAYEVIFSVPVRDLFAGTYREVEIEARQRAGQLAARLSEIPEHRLTPRTRRKIAVLRGIAAGRRPSS